MTLKNGICNTLEFDFRIIEGTKNISIKTKSKTKLKKCKDIITAFDIETSRIKEIDNSIMYIWQWHFKDYKTVIGRTWEEFVQFIDNLSEHIDSHLIVYVHNLSYEFQFLKGILTFESENVFATESRKVIKARYKNIEFRDSYILTNMSLAEFTNKYGVKVPKLTGFNYDVFRDSETQLTDDELLYCIVDVYSLCDALDILMKSDNDTLLTIPMTSTGYVRRDAKKAMRGYMPYLKPILPDADIYLQLRKAFRGGNTHANRYGAGYIIDNVQSYDRSSSYPDVQVNCKFPMSKFEIEKELPSFDTVLDLAKRRKRALLMEVIIFDIELIDQFDGAPYIPKSKCMFCVNGVEDNGRIISADALQIGLSDIDFEIIISQYKFTGMKFLFFAHARYSYLPRNLTNLTKQYYRDKTTLKGKQEQEIYYMKQKNKLNSIYGMSAQNPVHDIVTFNGIDYTVEKPDVHTAIEKNNQQAFQSYAWGVWVTAWARKRLQEGINLVEKQGGFFVYADTDSVKYTGTVDWTAYNNERMADSERNGAYADDAKGMRHYMGVYESEGIYDQFKTLGAKRYAYIKDGKIGCTIAGVPKKKKDGCKTGAEIIVQAGGLDAFEDGLIFANTGKLESVYNDVSEPFYYGKYLITSNVCLRPTTYTLGLTDDYKYILEHAQLYRECKKDIDFLLGGVL